jgi:two-component system, NtrC family, sensor kinase
MWNLNVTDEVAEAPPQTVADLQRRLDEALAQQTATAGVLKLISRSTFDLQAVLDTLVTSAAQLCAADAGIIWLRKDDLFHAAAASGYSQQEMAFFRDHPRTIHDKSLAPRVLRTGRTVHIPDRSLDPEFAFPGMSNLASTLLGVPLLRDDRIEGVFTLTRLNVAPFTPSQIEFVESFADQSMIAIENTRLMHETREALERQTATADILKVIASSPSDVQPVFDAIAASANRLIGGFSATVMLFVDDALHLVAFTGTNAAADQALQASFPRPLAEFPPFELVRGGETVEFPDTEAENVPPVNRELARLRGYRSMIFTPLMSNGAPVGILSVTRLRPGTFPAHHAQLLRTFADQAVIAIENARLFNELAARTEDLSESLRRQTATSEVLQIISSSPGNAAPVFQTILVRATRLCEADFGILYHYQDEKFATEAMVGVPPKFAEWLLEKPRYWDSSTALGRVAELKETVHIDDVQADPLYRQGHPLRVAFVDMTGARSFIAVPMLKDDALIGSICIFRQERKPFSDQQIEVVTNFAKQAVIAIENARLLNELRQRTDDLTDALTYQTGSSNILKVIASSPTDAGPVLRAIVDSACELCEADDAVLHLRDGDQVSCVAHRGPITPGLEKRPLDRSFVTGRSILDKVVIHLHDVLSEEGADFPGARQISTRSGTRTLLSVPLLREGESIGVIVLRRKQVLPFSDKQMAILQTFADQAVIAIGNVHLFEEVQARTRDLSEALQQQTATADVLKIISRSAFDLQTVFSTLIESAATLCRAERAAILRLTDNRFQVVATYGFPAEFREYMMQRGLDLDRGSASGRAALDRCTVHIPDILEDPDFTVQESQRRGGFRSVLAVPLLREGNPIGALFLTRGVVEAFTPHQIELVTTFADQAVIAIENARLFDEVQARTRELSQSLDDLRTAQDRLVQTEKLASLGQLTAGIAHEIKNPLNFVNNFAALSAELTDELDEALVPAPLDRKMRDEVGELTQMLRSNLEKVVQHGKRADSIVKNMLLHSREGSGERRASDLNALVRESLNLAYHGARAERSDFNITLQQDLDPDAGLVDVYPQELTRALLNLISNGFYAAVRRRTESDGRAVEPVLSAATKNAGSAVEIRIRDNGTGIPADIREKIFNPFFTTKPTGEGTGLGLSMTHDIIVKQHGGRIDVETEPGSFTEFIISLPRANESTAVKQPK